MAREQKPVIRFAVLIVCLGWAAAAGAQSDAERDAEIFGAPGVAPSPAPPPASPTAPAAGEASASASQKAGISPKAADGATALDVSDDREAEMFGASATTMPAPAAAGQDTAEGLENIEAAFAQTLKSTDNILTIGGFMFLRSEYDLKDDAALNWRQYPLVSPNLMDFYFDARPSDRVRGYMRSRLLYNPGLASGAQDPLTLQPLQQFALVLDQLWMKFDIARMAYITLGRQPVRWGVGRFWNPTDFLAQLHRDPLAIFDQRVGVTLLKVHVPWEARGWNFYAFADLTKADTLGHVGGALRAEAAWGQSEVSVSVAKHTDGPTQIGFDASTGVGWFDLRLELATQHGVIQPFFVDMGGSLRPVSHADTWLVQGVLGAEVSLPYNDNDLAVVGVEYFYNQLGYPNQDYYPAAIEAFVQLGTTLPLLYLGRQYVGAYAFFDKPGDWNLSSVTVTALGNLTDESWLVRFDYQVRALTYMDVNVYGVYHLGTRGGELHLASSAFNIPTARAEAGFGLRLYF